jgi:hypothetical protein
MTNRSAPGSLLFLTMAAFGCGASPRAAHDGGGGQSAGTAGSGGGAGVNRDGAGDDTTTSAGTAGTGAAGSVGSTGGTAGAIDAGNAAGSAGGSGAGTAGSGGAPGAAGAGTVEEDGGTGTFVMCDDHADFNGRGRCAATGNVGAVFAFENLTASASFTTLTAVFGTTNPPDAVGCTQEAVGAGCTAFTCPRGTGNPAGSSAGTITATSNGGTLTTKPGPSGVYEDAELPRALWNAPKAALTFAAAGATVPAFGETFCGPTPVMITSPAGVPGAGLTIDRSTDLPVAWTGGAGGDLEILLRDDTSVVGASIQIQCFFTASSGQGTVPKAALAKIGAGAHTVASFLWMRKIGGGGSSWCEELTAIMTNNSSTGAGAPFNGTATYQ